MKSKWNLPRGVVFVIWGIRLWGLWRGYIVQMSGSMTNHFRTPTKHEAKDTRQTTGKPLGTREQDPKTREPPPLVGPKNQKHRYTRTPRRNENFFWGRRTKSKSIPASRFSWCATFDGIAREFRQRFALFRFGGVRIYLNLFK